MEHRLYKPVDVSGNSGADASGLPDRTVYAVGRSFDNGTTPVSACEQLMPSLKGALVGSECSWRRKDWDGSGLVTCAYRIPEMFVEPSLKITPEEAEEDNEKMLIKFKEVFDKSEHNPFEAFNSVAAAYCFANDDNGDGKCIEFYNTPVREGEQINKCIRMGRRGVGGKWCREWFQGLNSESPGKRDALAKDFCDRPENLHTSECACLNAEKIDPDYRAIMQQLSDKKDAPAVCWYWPCSQSDDKVFLTEADRNVKNNCPDVCKNVLNAASEAGVSGNVINQEVACAGQVNGDEEEKLKVYLLGVGAVAVFLFILVIIFAVKSK